MAITGHHICCIIWELNPASDNTISASFHAKGLKIPQPLTLHRHLHILRSFCIMLCSNRHPLSVQDCHSFGLKPRNEVFQ